MEDIFLKFARQLIPSEILESFNVVDINDDSTTELIISLIEKENLIPSSEKELVLNGFLKEVELTHFPANGRACYLRLKRRRWKVKNEPTNPTSYYNNYDFTVDGTKATKNFGAFLKSFSK